LSRLICLVSQADVDETHLDRDARLTYVILSHGD
jgi:hypothetical protein